jgi:large subunit ribosomal protein L15
MLTLNNISPTIGARKNKKRVGRGPGSGNAKTAGKGHKGARARSGYSAKPGFEGGQMPLHRRLPKRGSNNLFKKQAIIISLDQLNTFTEGTVIDYNALLRSGLIKENDLVKILANGDITKSLTIKIENISHGAKNKILAAGGVFEE